MKTKLFILSLLTSVILTAQTAETQTEPTTKAYHRIGVQADATTGVGFSYKLSYNDKYQFQFVGIPVANSTTTYISAGLTFYRKVVNTRNFDILGYVGGSYLYNKSQNYYSYAYDSYDPYATYDPYTYFEPVTTVDQSVNASVGLAFEVFPSEIFKLCFKGGFGVYDMFDQYNWQTFPSAGVGVEVGINQILSKK